jgi:hypothetical protein
MESRSVATVLSWVLAAILVYILSVGPAVWLSAKGIVPERVCDTIYLPLQLVASTPVAGGILAKYVAWWIPPIGP